MRIKGNDIYVTRSESWTYSANIVSKDNAPFIVPQECDNPYFVFVIKDDYYDSSYIYKGRSRYDGPKFVSTIPEQAVDANLFDADYNRLYKLNDTYYYKTVDGVKEYVCDFIWPFFVKETEKWTKQQYTYKIYFMNAQNETDVIINDDNILEKADLIIPITEGRIFVINNLLEAENG